MFEQILRLIIESKIDQVAPLAKAVRGACSHLIQDEIMLYHIELCLFEAVTNCINHAYHRNPGHSIEVILTLYETSLTIQVIDTGDKIEKIVPKQSLDYDPCDVSTLPESGMGLFIIHQIMDEVIQQEDHGKNILVMKKQLEKEKIN